MKPKVGMKIYREGQELELLELSFRDEERELWRVMVLSEIPHRERYLFLQIGE